MLFKFPVIVRSELMIDGGADAAFGLDLDLPFENIFPRIHEFNGINVLAVYQDFIV